MKFMIIGFMFLFSFYSHAMIMGNGVIERVVDGDTFVIKTNNGSLSQIINSGYLGSDKYDYNDNLFVMRVANINTAESVHQDKNKNTNEGKNISELIKRNFTNKNIQYTCFKKGYYGRAICSFNYSGDNDYGAFMIHYGYSDYITSFGKHPYFHDSYLSIAKNKNQKSDKNDKSKREILGGYITKGKSLYQKYKELRN